MGEVDSVREWLKSELDSWTSGVKKNGTFRTASAAPQYGEGYKSALKATLVALDSQSR